MSDREFQIVLILINTILAVGGFIISFMIHRLYKSIEDSNSSQNKLFDLVTEHREDVLRNYVSTKQMSDLSVSFSDRINRFEDRVMNAIQGVVK